MATPLVHDGVMFLLSVPDTVLAMDAASGELLWEYKHALVGFQNPKIGLAIHGNKLLVPTSDMRVLALDNRTGELLWNAQITGPGQGPIPYSLRSAPLVANGVVIQGVTATMMPQGGFIFGLDLETGAELWRFHTVARPDEPGGNTWNDLPLPARSGGSVWIPGSYDPELDLVYFGAAPTYDTGPLLDSVNQPGVSNDALYTNSTLALRPRTGELVWHFQHVENDQWDLDWIYERQIVPVEFNGEQHKAVVTAGKMALFDAVDAATGEYLFSVDLGMQNVISAVDPETGATTIYPATIPNSEDGRLVCPFANGGRNWPATAYNPQTGMLFVPLAEVCMQSSAMGLPNQLLSTGVSLNPVPLPDSDGNFGRLQAVNLQTQELAWSFREPVTSTSAALATGGGVVFVGTLDNRLKAFNDSTGELLWQGELGDIPASFPIAYRVGDTQYVAVVIGQPSLHANIWLGFVNGALGSNSPITGLQRSGAAVVTFALD
jgi:alcohol dehydrogenase (cytochrome c)